jgi:hypothetical protein
MNFSLNRYGIIGSIDYNTPLCVIEEIMKCLGHEITIDDIESQRNVIIDYIKTEDKSITLKDSYTEEELTDISTFVSQKETSWDESNLIKAFNHIVGFNNAIPDSFVYGPKTNNNPTSYDVTMLYAYCVDNGIRTNCTDTLNELSAYVRLSFAKRHVLLDNLVAKISQIDIFGLINILKESKYGDKQEFVFSERSNDTVEKIKDGHILRTIFTNEEAIVYAAKKYNIDMSSSTCPSREILELIKSDNYRPVLDDNFKHNYKINPSYYDMTKFWKSKLSSLYTEKMLMTLLSNECVNYKDISDPRRFLHEITLTKNIYPGIVPDCDYTETFVYKTPFSELNPRHIISYGVLNSNKLIALTPNEITSFLRLHKDFKDFLSEGEIMSERNLKKLILICKTFPHEDKYSELLDTIRETKTIGIVMNSKMKEFISYVNNCDENTKSQINVMFDTMFKLGMTMRGWEEGSDYPLSDHQTTDFAMKYDEIETRSINMIKSILDTINGMSDTTKMIIKSLPLIKLSEKDKTYYRNTNSDEGLTFYDRLMLISTKPDSIYSCLRLSSNYIVSTAQYYNVLLNSKSYIDITKLDFIQ